LQRSRHKTNIISRKKIEAAGNGLCGFFKGWLPLSVSRSVKPKMNKFRFILLVAVVFFFSRTAYGEWTPPYEEEELDKMNNALQRVLPKEPWKTWRKYTKVKNVFKGKTYSAPTDYKPDSSEFDRVPEYFQNESKAKSAGAECEYIKSTKEKTCVLLVVEGQGAGLVLYDRDNIGHYNKNQTICVPTNYQVADVDFLDIFKNGRKVSRYPRASPWHFFTEQASLDLNPALPASEHIL